MQSRFDGLYEFLTIEFSNSMKSTEAYDLENLILAALSQHYCIIIILNRNACRSLTSYSISLKT